MEIPMALEAANFAAQADIQMQIQEAHHMSWRQRMGIIGMAVLPLAGASCAAAPAPAPAMSEAAFVRVMEINTTMAPSDKVLDRLVKCEASSEPTKVSASGKYMGLGQFDQGTWNGTVGGVAQLGEFVGVHPNHAPASVQRAAIRALYSVRGRAPWPQCGRFLK